MKDTQRKYKFYFNVLILSSVFFLMSNYLTALPENDHYERILSGYKGTYVVYGSTSHEKKYAIYLIDEVPERGWLSGKSSPFPHVFVYGLAGNAGIHYLKFRNSLREESHPGISAREIQVEFSTLSSISGYNNLKNFILEKKLDVQEFKIEEAKARWIRLTIKSNYGNPNYTELMEFEAWGKFDFKILPVFFNFIWILGAALILFNFSLHGFLAQSTPMKFRDLMKRTSFQRLFLIGLILIAGGICVSVNNLLAAAVAGGITLFLIILLVKKLM